eukprot:TRINITY_DN63059_c0_g1_i1.p1 TRINITY_DN63059_c0_g1~~TRINITY_DN63059_c0_g1_i1.p1  ORF type:complete len:357 (-),score=54.86 TRINITY_DN63059_c0_g1_i1:13-1083(-)
MSISKLLADALAEKKRDSQLRLTQETDQIPHTKPSLHRAVTCPALPEGPDASQSQESTPSIWSDVKKWTLAMRATRQSLHQEKVAEEEFRESLTIPMQQVEVSVDRLHSSGSRTPYSPCSPLSPLSRACSGQSHEVDISDEDDELESGPGYVQAKLRRAGGGRQVQPNPAIVLFLDVDGVLHPSSRREVFASSCMHAFEQIVRGCNATVVLSSDWRLKPQAQSAVDYALRKYGLAGIRDRTPDLSSVTSRREDEILDWLCRHPEVQHWLAIDDANLAPATSPHRSIMRRHFLKVDPKTGLQRCADVDKALRLLPRERGDVEQFWSVRPVDRSLAPTYPGVRRLGRGGSQPLLKRRY